MRKFLGKLCDQAEQVVQGEVESQPLDRKGYLKVVQIMAEHKCKLELLRFREPDAELVLNRLIERLLTFQRLKKVKKNSECPTSKKLNFGVCARLALLTLEYQEIFLTLGRRREAEPRCCISHAHDGRTSRLVGTNACERMVADTDRPRVGHRHQD